MTRKLFKETFQLKESQCTVIADKAQGIEAALASLKRNRQALEDYAQNNPFFLVSFEPVASPEAPLVARLMAEVSAKAGVGPLAAVAGVLADLAVRDMVAAGCKVAVVEDGGEISAVSDRAVDVAVAAGDTEFSKRFGFRLTSFPVGVATSSGRFSRAFSFGSADSATVFCRTAGLADAAATVVCNVVKGDDCEAAVQRGVDRALSIEGVDGVLVMYNGFTGTAGKIPQIIKVNAEAV